MHLFATLLYLTEVISLVSALPSQEEQLQTKNLCPYGNLDVWQISEDQPDAVIHHGWPERSLFNVKQIVADRDRYKRGSSRGSYQHHYDYNDDENKNLHGNPKPSGRVFTIGNSITSGLGVYGCELRFAIASNVTSLVMSGQPVISAKIFNWHNDWSYQPTWRNVMGSNSSRAHHIGPTLGKVEDIHLGQDDIINATECPPGMGTPVGRITFIAFMFEIDESVEESAEVEFTMWTDHSLYNRTMAGVWVRFPSPTCEG